MRTFSRVAARVGAVAGGVALVAAVTAGPASATTVYEGPFDTKPECEAAKVENPAAFGQCFYFRLGGGWYYPYTQ